MAQLIGENNNFQLIEPIFRFFSGIGYIWGGGFFGYENPDALGSLIFLTNK